MTALLKHGRRLTMAERNACRKEGTKRAADLYYRGPADLAASSKCHRSTARYWMGNGGRPSLPGPKPGSLKRPLTDDQKTKAREYRAGGMSVPSLARALSEDFPESRITEHQIRRLKREEKWPDLRPKKMKQPHKTFEKSDPGFAHMDAIIGPTTKCPIIFTARERSSRFSFAKVSQARDSAAAADFLQEVVNPFPLIFHTVLTDNGSEFAKDFAAAASKLALKHKHTRPRHPQTNGMVERFNGMLKPAVIPGPTWWFTGSEDWPTDGERFYCEKSKTQLPDHRVDRMQRDVDRYLLWINTVKPNRQLGWKTPLECLKNLAGESPDSFRHSINAIISPEILHRISAGLGGRRYLPAPPDDWLPGGGLSAAL
jgi:Integrase core domain